MPIIRQLMAAVMVGCFIYTTSYLSDGVMESYDHIVRALHCFVDVYFITEGALQSILSHSSRLRLNTASSLTEFLTLLRQLGLLDIVLSLVILTLALSRQQQQHEPDLPVTWFRLLRLSLVGVHFLNVSSAMCALLVSESAASQNITCPPPPPSFFLSSSLFFLLSFASAAWLMVVIVLLDVSHSAGAQGCIHEGVRAGAAALGLVVACVCVYAPMVSGAG
jgi:hypothetical protein